MEPKESSSKQELSSSDNEIPKKSTTAFSEKTETKFPESESKEENDNQKAFNTTWTINDTQKSKIF